MTNSHMLLVSDGAFPDVHEKINNSGQRITLLIPMGTITSLENLGLHERVIGLPTSASVEEWVEQATLVHRLDPVDAIGGFNELTEEQAAAIAEALGLPFHPVELVARTHHKDKMRELLREAGIDPTASRRVETAAEIESFAEAHGYPIILKPVDGRGSAGVSLVRRVEDIEPAITWFRESARPSALFVEEYLAGEEFSVEAMSENGKHRMICITQKYKETVHFVELGHCIPAVVNPATESDIYRVVDRALSALGVSNGPSHTEVIVAQDGPRIVETHTRLGGDRIPELIESISGIDLLDLWIRQALGEKVMHHLPESLSKNTFAAIWYASPQAVGTIERIKGEEQARTIPGVVRVAVRKGTGSEVKGVHDSFSRAAYAIATGRSPNEAVERAQQAAGQLRFLVSCKGW
jgi:biotin carboxylase